VRMMDSPAYGETIRHLENVSNLNDDHTYEYIPFHPEDHSEPYDQPVFPVYEQSICVCNVCRCKSGYSLDNMKPLGVCTCQQ